MTPSEIAEWLSVGGDWATAAKDHEGAEKHYQAAVAIRELEAERDTWRAMAENNGKAIIQLTDISVSDRAKLKIATEALECAEKEVDCHWELGRDCADEEWVDRSWGRLNLIRQALARIKEV